MAFYFWGLLAPGLVGAQVFSSHLEFLVPFVAVVAVLTFSLIPGLTDAYLVQTLVWLGISGAGRLILRNKLKILKQVTLRRVADPVAGKNAVVVEAIEEQYITQSGKAVLKGSRDILPLDHYDMGSVSL